MPGRRVFTPDEVLTAANVNDYLMDQAVPRFASPAARDAQWPAPPNGAMCVTVDTTPPLYWQRNAGVWQRAATLGRWEVSGTPSVPANTATILTPSSERAWPGFHLNGTQLVVDAAASAYRVTVTLTYQATVTASAYFIVGVQHMRAGAQQWGHESVQGTNGQTWGNIMNDYAYAGVAAGDYFQVTATSDGAARTVQGYRSAIVVARADGL